MFPGSVVLDIAARMEPKNASTSKWLVVPRIRIGVSFPIALICET